MLLTSSKRYVPFDDYSDKPKDYSDKQICPPRLSLHIFAHRSYSALIALVNLLLSSGLGINMEYGSSTPLCSVIYNMNEAEKEMAENGQEDADVLVHKLDYMLNVFMVLLRAGASVKAQYTPGNTISSSPLLCACKSAWWSGLSSHIRNLQTTLISSKRSNLDQLDRLELVGVLRQ